MISLVRPYRFLFIHHHIDFHFKGGTYSVYFNSLIDFLDHPTSLVSVHRLRHLRRHHHRRRLAAHCLERYHKYPQLGWETNCTKIEALITDLRRQNLVGIWTSKRNRDDQPKYLKNNSSTWLNVKSVNCYLICLI